SRCSHYVCQIVVWRTNLEVTPKSGAQHGATVAMTHQKRLHQARRRPFERDGKRLLLSGASRREAARPTLRLGIFGWGCAHPIVSGLLSPSGVKALAD
ncbi:hypothetical protein LJD47_29825, partial [Escherichia coli]|nr:hypothetical protein [Escherichia coli]